MPLFAQPIADGQLPGTKGTLYEVPVGQRMHATFFRVSNTSGSNAYTFNIYVKRAGGGTSRRIIGADKPMAASEEYDVLEDGRTFRLSAGDVIEGDASTADVLDYLILGAIET
jgi:hypothetical protein